MPVFAFSSIKEQLAGRSAMIKVAVHRKKNLWMWRYLKTVSCVWRLPWIKEQHCDSQLPEVQHGSRAGNVTCVGRGGGLWGEGGPDVVVRPWGINSIGHTAGGGKRGERKGEENEWARNNGKQEAETLQHNARRASCRLRQIRNNTLFKAVFSPPNVSQSLKPHLTALHCTTAVIMRCRKCGILSSWNWKEEVKTCRPQDNVTASESNSI